MLVLCDNAGCFYYKPTTVWQRLKKELEYKLFAFVLHTANK